MGSLYLGVEIGGTKLQLGLGPGDGTILGQWRGAVDPAAGGEGIRRQISAALPTLLSDNGLSVTDLRGVGVGFGGPTDDATQSVIKSHHIAGWDGFPLARFFEEMLSVPAVICNDADVAGLAEALFGAGRGLSPVFYMTVGSGIGGGLVIGGEIYRGVGKGAAEVGHLRPAYPLLDEPHDGILEDYAAGWGIARRAGAASGQAVFEAAAAGDEAAVRVVDEAAQALAEGVCSVIKLLCPRRIVIGGGVSLAGEVLFGPLRRRVAERGFAAFAGLTDIVPAELGEAVVVHGALGVGPPTVRRVDCATEDDMTPVEFWHFCNRPENEAFDYELIRGEVVRRPRTTRRHGVVVSRLAAMLSEYAWRVGRGVVVGCGSGQVLPTDPASVVGLDAAVCPDELSDELTGWGTSLPLLVAEVIDGSADTSADKLPEYLTSGVPLTWLVDLDRHRVVVHEPNGVPLVAELNDTLQGGQTLPGLTVRVSDCFRRPAEAVR